jgi:hypothetical protein
VPPDRHTLGQEKPYGILRLIPRQPQITTQLDQNDWTYSAFFNNLAARYDKRRCGLSRLTHFIPFHEKPKTPSHASYSKGDQIARCFRRRSGANANLAVAKLGDTPITLIDAVFDEPNGWSMRFKRLLWLRKEEAIRKRGQLQ